jgi:hypothetical protein
LGGVEVIARVLKPVDYVAGKATHFGGVLLGLAELAGRKVKGLTDMPGLVPKLQEPRRGKQELAAVEGRAALLLGIH